MRLSTTTTRKKKYHQRMVGLVLVSVAMSMLCSGQSPYGRTNIVVSAETASSRSAEKDVSPRVLLRERFPSGLKIDRFSTSWPSSASVMADMLEGATAREMLQKERSMSKKERQEQLRQADELINKAPPQPWKSTQRAPPFKRADDSNVSTLSSSSSSSNSGKAAGGLVGLAAVGAGLVSLARSPGGLNAFMPFEEQSRRLSPPSTTPKKVVAPSSPVVAQKSRPKLPPPPPGTATIPEHTFNLVKAIVGVGVLSLPSGIAAFGDAPSAVLPALGLITVMGALSAVGFSWIGQVCHYTGARSYTEAWTRTVGPSTASLPAWSTTIKTFLACLAYSMVLADSLTTLAPIDSRTTVLWTITGGILLPLCWLKNLKSLAPFSLLGVMGMVYTSLAMTYRWARGSYLGGSPLLAELAENLQPNFGSKGFKSVLSPNSVILVSMLSTAYMAHFSAPRYKTELKDNTIPRFNTVVMLGFGISILLTAWISAVGFSTFGGACSGLVLNNYAKSDLAMSISRSAVAVSLIFSYPLAFQGCRDGFLDLLGVKQPNNMLLNGMTVVLLLVLTVLATVLNDVSFVLSFGGATLGNLLCYVYPALMYMKVRPDMTIPAVLLASSGVITGSIGTKLALNKLK